MELRGKREGGRGKREEGRGKREEEYREQLSIINEELNIVNLQNIMVNGDGVVNPVENKVNKAVLKEIRSIDPVKITPLEALKLVNRWKQKLAEQAPDKKTQSSKDSTPSLFD